MKAASISHISFSKPNLAKQISTFGLVGIMSTLIDFTVLNIVMITLGVSVIAANIAGITTAMIFSYFANKSWVFKEASQSTSQKPSALKFILITLVGLYVIQTLVILLFTHVITFPSAIAGSILSMLGLSLTPTLVAANTAKLIATVASAIWNFVLYKKVVFKN